MDMNKYVAMLEAEIAERRKKVEILKAVMADILKANPATPAAKKYKKKKKSHREYKPLPNSDQETLWKCLQKYPGRSRHFYAKQTDIEADKLDGMICSFMTQKRVKSVPLDPGKRTDLDRKVSVGYYPT